MLPLRYPESTWRGTVPNMGGTLVDPPLIVVHVMQGTLEGTDSWFHNPSAEVSAHFGVGRDGTVYQWVLLDRVAWAEANYNEAAISIEHEGFSSSVALSAAAVDELAPATRAMYEDRHNGLTQAQLTSSGKLIHWLATEIAKERGIPFADVFRRTNKPTVGVIGHGELGVPGGDHPDCPGSVIMDQFNVALRLPAADAIPAEAKTPLVKESPAIAPAKVKGKSMDVKELVPTKAQLATFVAEAGSLTVFVNDFVKFAHPGGTELVLLNAAATGLAWISHTFNKKKAAAQAKPPVKSTASSS